MILKNATLCLVGGLAVYVAMAACAAKAPAREETAGASTTTGGIGDPVGAAQAQSGSRLKAKWVSGSDGSKQFVGFYDSERSEDCSFQKAGDGTTRCMPASSGSVYNAFFSDAGCAQPLLSVPVGSVSCQAPKYGFTLLGGCGGSDIRAVGSMHAGQVFMKTSSACDPVSGPLVPTAVTFYSVGNAIAASAFVQGSETMN